MMMLVLIFWLWYGGLGSGARRGCGGGRAGGAGAAAGNAGRADAGRAGRAVAPGGRVLQRALREDDRGRRRGCAGPYSFL